MLERSKLDHFARKLSRSSRGSGHCARRVAIHVDLAIQAVVDSEGEDPRRTVEETSDRLPPLEPTQTRTVQVASYAGTIYKGQGRTHDRTIKPSITERATGMTAILAIHGIGQQLEGPHTLYSKWWPAIQDGVKLAGEDLVYHAALEFVFYGDLFRRPGHLALGDPPFDVADVNSLDAQLLDLWWREAATIDPAVVHPEATTLAAVPRVAQRALNALLNSSFFVRIAERALIFDLKQVHAYMRDEAIKAAILARVTERITDQVKIVVAHSLGTVIAYEALCAHPEWPVHTLVTLGSPLGIPGLIFDQLRPPPKGGLGCWPGSVHVWVNMADSGDVVALEKDLRRQFGSRVENLLVDNGASAHDVRPYLTAKETGRAIARALKLAQA